MNDTIEIQPELYKQFQLDASKKNMHLTEHIREKYHSDKIVFVFQRDEEGLFMPFEKDKRRVTDSEFKLYQALNDVVVTIIHASKRIKQHGKDII